MTISENGKNLIKNEERCVLRAYKDQGGVLTIGWGNTRYEDGTRVKAGDVISQGRADRLFDHVVSLFADRVAGYLTRPVSQNEFDALCSFSYNVGSGEGGFETSTLRKLVNAGASCEDITAQFMKWNKVKGQVVAGLTNRRRREASLYCKA